MGTELHISQDLEVKMLMFLKFTQKLNDLAKRPSLEETLTGIPNENLYLVL